VVHSQPRTKATGGFGKFKVDTAKVPSSKRYAWMAVSGMAMVVVRRKRCTSVLASTVLGKLFRVRYNLELLLTC
jgi:hypothetical protein